MRTNHKRPMHSGGGNGHNGGGHNNNGQRRFHRNNNGGVQQGNNRPRKNYGALREKYLAQARDALSSGDRVLAENYLQHADHYYRMMMEEMERRPNWTPPPANTDGQLQEGQTQEQHAQQQEDQRMEMSDGMDDAPAAGSLPSFLTRPIVQQSGEESPPVPVSADWEE